MEGYLLTLLASITAAALFVALTKVIDDKRLKKLFLLITLLFVFFLLTKVAIISPEDNRLNYTFEESRYWNCSVLNHSCSGQVLPEACGAYSLLQCNELDAAGENCSWGQGVCVGTPTWSCQQLGTWGHENGYGHTKCTETEGCVLTFELVQGTCDEITVTYNYEHTPPFAEEIDTMELTEIITMFIVFLLILAFFLTDALKFVYKWVTSLQLKYQGKEPPT